MTAAKTPCEAGRCEVVASVKGETCDRGRVWRFTLACGATVQRRIKGSNPVPKHANCKIGVVPNRVEAPAESERAA